MQILSFKPKQVTKRLTSHLSARGRDVVLNRFGLTAEAKRRTLEEIGQKYGITRERVRQVEEASLNLIKKSDAYKKEQKIFEELKALIHSLGALIAEEELLGHISKDQETQNHFQKSFRGVGSRQLTQCPCSRGQGLRLSHHASAR